MRKLSHLNHSLLLIYFLAVFSRLAYTARITSADSKSVSGAAETRSWPLQEYIDDFAERSPYGSNFDAQNEQTFSDDLNEQEYRSMLLRSLRSRNGLDSGALLFPDTYTQEVPESRDFISRSCSVNNDILSVGRNPSCSSRVDNIQHSDIELPSSALGLETNSRRNFPYGSSSAHYFSQKERVLVPLAVSRNIRVSIIEGSHKIVIRWNLRALIKHQNSLFKKCVDYFKKGSCFHFSEECEFSRKSNLELFAQYPRLGYLKIVDYPIHLDDGYQEKEIDLSLWMGNEKLEDFVLALSWQKCQLAKLRFHVSS